MSTGLGMAVLHEVGGWVVKAVLCPPRLMLNWVIPESHRHRLLCSFGAGMVSQAHSKIGNDVG